MKKFLAFLALGACEFLDHFGETNIRKNPNQKWGGNKYDKELEHAVNNCK